MPSTTPSRRFLTLFALFTAAGLAAVAALNVLVDPYGIYRVWQRAGLNANKAEQLFHDRLVSAHAVRRLRPDALLLGTSRTQVGLEPGTLEPHAARPLNVGLSGGTVQESLRLLQHAAALGEVKLAVVGLDVLSFNAYALPNPEYSDARLAVRADGSAQPLSFAADWLPTLLSLQGLRASALTVLRQKRPSYFYDGGRRREATLEARIAEQGGMRKTLLWSEAFYLGEYQCFALRRQDGAAPALEDLSRLLGFARERGIRVVLFFSPSHARSHLALQAAGHWSAFEQWKEEVTRLAAQHGAALWEFSGADPRFTAEPVPPASDSASRMRWYWESSHYRRELGDLVLSRILGEARPGSEGFGVRLEPGNLKVELARVSEEVGAYAAAHPDEVEEIGRVAASQRAAWRRCGNGAPGPVPLVPPPRPGIARGE